MKFTNTEDLKDHIARLVEKENTFSKDLLEKYPDLFEKDKDGNAIMPSSGIYCPVGWQNMIESLCNCLDTYVKNHVNYVQINTHKHAIKSFIHKNIIVPIHNWLYEIVTPYKFFKGYKSKGFWVISEEIQKEVKSKYKTRLAIMEKLTKFSKFCYPKYEYVHPPVEPIKILQIKEKFGTLRFYHSGGDEQTRGMVRFVEHLSAYTCETCGENGNLSNKNHWYKTLCDKHANELNFKNEHPRTSSI